MHERRKETRMMCADLVDVHWKDAEGNRMSVVANLEDISSSGACLQTEVAIPVETSLRIEYPKGKLKGTVLYCHFEGIGYFLGILFEKDVKWSPEKFKPQHLLDPRRVVVRASKDLTQPLEDLTTVQ